MGRIYGGIGGEATELYSIDETAINRWRLVRDRFIRSIALVTVTRL